MLCYSYSSLTLLVGDWEGCPIHPVKKYASTIPRGSPGRPLGELSLTHGEYGNACETKAEVCNNVNSVNARFVIC